MQSIIKRPSLPDLHAPMPTDLRFVCSIAILVLWGLTGGAQSAHGDSSSSNNPDKLMLAPSSIAELSSDRIASERRHLWRVLAWGGANAVGGGALWMTADDDPLQSVGLQSALWGAVNVGIATVGLLRQDAEPDAAFGNAVRAERRYHDILLVNLGLNVGYMGVGAAMVIAGSQGVDNADAWRGHGAALILQGLGLFVLDAVSWVASRSRLGDLVVVPGDTSATAAPGGLGVTVRF